MSRYQPKNQNTTQDQPSSNYQGGERRRYPRGDRRPENNNGNHETREKYSRDEDKIFHYSELPQLPATKKTKPNEENFKAKMKDLEDSLLAVKAERKIEKESIEKLTVGFTDKIKAIDDNIVLGREALKLLDGDELRAEQEARKIRSTINELERRRNRAAQPQRGAQRKRPDQMNVEEIDAEISRHQQRLINENLDKKGTSEVHNEINKLKALRVNASKAPTSTADSNNKQNEDDEHDRKMIAQHTEDLNKQLRRKVEAKIKIELVQNELKAMEDQKKEVQAEKEKVENGPEHAKARELKDKIYTIREDIKQLEKRYYKAYDEWKEEQDLIEYVDWATKVKERKIQQHEKVKEERRKQKGREARREERQKDEKGGEEGVAKERVRPPPPHPYAREIESVRFLTNYVERLKPQSKTESPAEQAAKKDIASELKKGAWTKEKGIQVIVSKKDRDIDAPAATNNNKKKIKEQVSAKEVPSGQLNHSIEVVRIFDNLKILPPTTEEEIESVKGLLEEKLQYFLSAKPEDRPQQTQQGGSTFAGKPYRRREDEPREQPRETQPKVQKKPVALSSGDFPELP